MGHQTTGPPPSSTCPVWCHSSSSVYYWYLGANGTSDHRALWSGELVPLHLWQYTGSRLPPCSRPGAGLLGKWSQFCVMCITEWLVPLIAWTTNCMASTTHVVQVLYHSSQGTRTPALKPVQVPIILVSCSFLIGSSRLDPLILTEISWESGISK